MDAPSRTSGKAIASLVCGILSFTCLPALLAIVFGILGLLDVSRGRGRVRGQGLAIAGIITGALLPLVGLALLVMAYLKVHETAARITSMKNLHVIGLSMLDYVDRNGRFPNAAITNRAGKPLLSWRVALLPYLGEDQLYRQFKLNEPWDSVHNRKLLSQMPKIYAHPSADPSKTAEGNTYYQVFVGEQTLFPPGKASVSMASITDGASATLMVIEAADPVPWTKPEDLPYSLHQPLARLGDFYSNGTNAAFADGSVHLIPRGTPEATLRAWITRNGNEPVAPPE
jgi:prepilin-type processing-associated H-X9-DG protein